MANLRKASAEGAGGFDGVTLAEALAVLFELQRDGELAAAVEADDDAAADSSARRSA